MSKKKPRAHIPRATYRLQFNHDFTFSKASKIVPYLADLGIGDCYASPYMKARPGSMHGYDIIDHTQLNPEIGSEGEYRQFVATLHAYHMGQLLDLVPNHMGVGGSENRWWHDVLENGQASAYAAFFDIDWNPTKEELRGKVLLPILGNHYRAVLEAGELTLCFNAGSGEFTVRYWEHSFPLDPRTYAGILAPVAGQLERSLDPADLHVLTFESLLTAFSYLPGCSEASPKKRAERERDKEQHKLRLAQICALAPAVKQAIEAEITRLNGQGGKPRSFKELHGLLESQPYRLAYWRVASDEINYRRFFNINDLAGLRMENKEVFEATHRTVFSFIEQGFIDGLRIDHPDGLYNPQQYFKRLQKAISKLVGGNEKPAPYLVIEKILAPFEQLPQKWPVHGTTGYEFANITTGLFVDSAGKEAFSRLYADFTGMRQSFDDILHERKKVIMRGYLSSELNVLSRYLSRISESHNRAFDFTFNGLRSALMEVVASFPVYRTYIAGTSPSPDDLRYITWAIVQAKRRSPTVDLSIFDFIGDVLSLRLAGNDDDPNFNRAVSEFALKFQQYTGPVMAKGLEDTSFYVYNRLVALNEVGGDPRHFGLSVADFHHLNAQRARFWPSALLATSTHDSKRSEDVRARIAVLSELPHLWQENLERWALINRNKKTELSSELAPSANDEYLLYQTLLGALPFEELTSQVLEEFRPRITAYMLKAIREAQVNTSWINQNASYEEATQHFVEALLESPQTPFMKSFLPFARRIAHLGIFNSLSQTLLKLTSPGVPDIYQGTELWDFSLVDPDNRRPVNYALRQYYLETLKAPTKHSGAPNAQKRAYSLLGQAKDGRIKLFLTWKALGLRKRHPDLFEQGTYHELEVAGRLKDHLVAFARLYGEQCAVTVVPRLLAGLLTPEHPFPLGDFWNDTWVVLPQDISRASSYSYVNLFTDEPCSLHQLKGRSAFAAPELLSHFPVALLEAIRQEVAETKETDTL